MAHFFKFLVNLKYVLCIRFEQVFIVSRKFARYFISSLYRYKKNEGKKYIKNYFVIFETFSDE